jgi:hypothetical protein
MVAAWTSNDDPLHRTLRWMPAPQRFPSICRSLHERPDLDHRRASAVTIAISSAAGALTPAASTTTDVEKTYSVGGQLRIGGSVAYSISNANGTITVTVGSVENDSPTTASGPIRLRVILTSAPISSGAFNYYMIGEGASTRCSRSSRTRTLR